MLTWSPALLSCGAVKCCLSLAFCNPLILVLAGACHWMTRYESRGI